MKNNLFLVLGFFAILGALTTTAYEVDKLEKIEACEEQSGKMIDGYCITQCHGFSNKEDCTSAGFRVINGNNALYKNYCEWSEKNVACKPECWQLSQGTTMEPDYEAMCREVGCLWEYGHSPESRTSRCVETSAPEKL